MQKFDPIDRKDFQISGREYEDFYAVYNKDLSDTPLIVDCAGVTHPLPNYFIKRSDANFYVFEYIIGGKGYLIYDDKRFELQKGDFFLLEPHTKQYCYSDKFDPMHKYFVVFYCDMLRTVLQELDLSGVTLFSGFDAQSEMAQICELVKNVPNNSQIAYPVLHLVMDLLLRLAQHRRNSVNGGTPAVSETASKTKQILDESLTVSTDITAISKALFRSRSSVNREFIRAYGISPYQYLLNKRIELAKNLLKNTDYSVKDIASILVFADSFHFSNVFKHKTGKSPTEYRKTSDSSQF